MDDTRTPKPTDDRILRGLRHLLARYDGDNGLLTEDEVFAVREALDMLQQMN